MYCVAKINFFDNELHQYLIDSDARLLEVYLAEAYKDLGDTFYDEVKSFTTEEEFKRFYFNCDMMINILPV